MTFSLNLEYLPRHADAPANRPEAASHPGNVSQPCLALRRQAGQPGTMALSQRSMDRGAPIGPDRYAGKENGPVREHRAAFKALG